MRAPGVTYFEPLSVGEVLTQPAGARHLRVIATPTAMAALLAELGRVLFDDATRPTTKCWRPRLRGTLVDAGDHHLLRLRVWLRKEVGKVSDPDDDGSSQ